MRKFVEWVKGLFDEEVSDEEKERLRKEAEMIYEATGCVYI